MSYHYNRGVESNTIRQSHDCISIFVLIFKEKQNVLQFRYGLPILGHSQIQMNTPFLLKLLRFKPIWQLGVEHPVRNP